MIEEKTCAFTGHREIADDLDVNFLRDCLQELMNEGYDTFLCGMARGFDLLAGELIISLKEKNPHVKLIACVPCPGQERYYQSDERQKYERVLSACDEVKVISEKFYKGCMLTRDRYMADNSSLLLAYERKNTGGTHYTVNYALSKKKRVLII